MTLRKLCEEAIARWDDCGIDLRNMFPMEKESATLARALLAVIVQAERVRDKRQCDSELMLGTLLFEHDAWNNVLAAMEEKPWQNWQ